jgi:hypothetical protein
MAKKEFSLKAFVNVLLVVGIIAVLATEITGAVTSVTEKLCRTNTDLLEYGYDASGARVGKVTGCKPGYACENAACVAMPDLLVDGIKIAKKDSKAIITASIKNAGAADSSETKLYLEVNEETEKAGLMKYDPKIGSIGAGQTLSINVEHLLKNPYNEISSVSAEIDSPAINANYNREGNEANNRKEYP